MKEKHNNHHLRTPEELFKSHEDYAYGALIDHSKQEDFYNILNEFSLFLLDAMQSSKEVCSKFYISQIRGFSLKIGKNKFDEDTVEFGELFFDYRIYPFELCAFDKDNHDYAVIQKWLDLNFQKYLLDLGWACGVKRGSYGTPDKIVIYQAERKTIQHRD